MEPKPKEIEKCTELPAQFNYIGRPALRVKIKHLACEAKIIRQEEQKYGGQSSARGLLRHHRIEAVRNEARSAQLAYAYLRGCRTRSQTEQTDRPIDEARVRAIIRKFGKGLAEDWFADWLKT